MISVLVELVFGVLCFKVFVFVCLIFVMKEKEICTSFSVASQTAQVMTIEADKCLVKMEKMLNSWVEDPDRKGVSSEGNVLCQKAVAV